MRAILLLILLLVMPLANAQQFAGKFLGIGNSNALFWQSVR